MPTARTVSSPGLWIFSLAIAKSSGANAHKNINSKISFINGPSSRSRLPPERRSGVQVGTRSEPRQTEESKRTETLDCVTAQTGTLSTLRRLERSSLSGSLRIVENERSGRMTTFCSRQRHLRCFQEWRAVLTDAATQGGVPRREFSLGVTQGTFAQSFFK